MSNGNETITMKLKGVDELLAALKAIPDIAEAKVMRRGLSRGGARLRTFMKRNARRITGELVKSIGLKKLRGKKPRYIVGLITNRYYSVLDKGRKPFTRNGRAVAGTPRFDSEGTGIERAWLAHREDIAQMIIDEAKKEFAKEAGKLYVKRTGGL
jgi:hypothetical protein